MHYVMARDSGASTSRFIRFREIEPEEDGRQWMAGKAFEAPPAGVVLSSANEQRLPFSEFALNDHDIPIYSQKLRDTLQALGISNIQYCPVTLHDRGNEVRRDDYRIANILDPQDCIDHAKAKFERSDSGRMLRLKQFTLVENRIRSGEAGQPKPCCFA